jgi:hypothetical protein
MRIVYHLFLFQFVRSIAGTPAIERVAVFEML